MRLELHVESLKAGSKSGSENPDRPDFCPPFEAGDPDRWLERATAGLVKLCATNEARYSRELDAEVIAAIYMKRELQNSSELQAAWCQLPDWSKVKSKTPKPGITENLLQEVFRFQWAVLRGDQDGYELRFRAVKRHYRPHLAPEDIVSLIQSHGGYKKAGRNVQTDVAATADQEAAVVGVEPDSVSAVSPKAVAPSAHGKQDRPRIVAEMVFDDCLEEAKARQGKWDDWRVKSDWDTDPPVFIVSRVGKKPRA